MAWISKEDLENFKKTEKKLVMVRELQRGNSLYEEGVKFFVTSIIRTHRVFIREVGFELHNPDSSKYMEFSNFNLKVYDFELSYSGCKFTWKLGYKDREITYEIILSHVDTDSYKSEPNGMFTVAPVLAFLLKSEYKWKKDYTFKETHKFLEDIKQNLKNDEYLKRFSSPID
jgi:hypothetical protein